MTAALPSEDEGARPRADLLAEGARVADGMRSLGARVCITGGVGVAMRCPSAREAPLARTYADLDVVGRSRQRREITAAFERLGYAADERFNLLQGDTRLLFWDTGNQRQVDVILNRLEMCHTIELGDRLDAAEQQTLPLADLLLCKLQIMETNRKDLVDAAALLLDHPFTPDETGINIEYLSKLTSSDWGLWRTTTIVVQRVSEFAQTLDGLSEDQRQTIQQRARDYSDALDASDKSRAWRLRARVGERKRWYAVPEEVE
jgi:hypothetical protein